MRTFGYLIAGIIGAVIALAATHFGQTSIRVRTDHAIEFVTPDLSYTDFVTVMFTGATLVLAGVALVVGLIAAFTYQGIKQEARSSVLKAASEAKEHALKTLHEKVEQQVASIDTRIEKEISVEAKKKIARVIEQAGLDGALDKALERALAAISMGSGTVDRELEQEENGER